MLPSKKLIFFLVFSVLMISFVFYGYQICYTPNILVEKSARPLVIPRGATFKDVQSLLNEGKYIDDIVSFSFLAKLMGYNDHVKPGRYLIPSNQTNLQAIRILRAGIQEPVKITFNNVRLPKDLSEKITRNLNMKPSEFQSALIRFAMNNPYGFNKDNILCMFIPNTYEVYFNVTPEDLIERLHSEYEKFWTEERRQKAAAAGLTPIEVSILASIVQAESVREEEAPVIAGLYINRLKKDIPLQADPTLVFAVGD
ncbi:MAG TPA: endolytic transglycosylase MltG, partial [Chryseosolibacter sp.]